MYVLNKSFASGHPVARRLPAAWNTDGMFSQSRLHFPMAREALKQLSLLRGAVSASSASHPVFCTHHSKNVIPREALCRTRDFSLVKLEGGLRIRPRTAMYRHHTGHSFI